MVELDSLRVLSIPVKPGIAFEATPDPGQSLGEALTLYGEATLQGDKYTIVEREPLKPHTVVDGAHTVLWPVLSKAWNARDTHPLVVKTKWKEIMKDNRLLDALDTWQENRRTTHPDALLYSMIGHGSKTTQVDEPIQISYKIASLPWPHFHSMTTQIPHDHPNQTWIAPNNPGYSKALEIQSDAARQRTIELLSDRLEKYGTPISVMLALGQRETIQLPRTVYGFHSLSDALKSTHALLADKEIKRRWPEVIRSIADETAPYPNHLPPHLRLRQGFEPSAMIVYPSDKMKDSLKSKDNFRWWSFPFSPWGTFSYYVPGGITLRRPPRI